MAGVEPEDILPITKSAFKERQGVDCPPKNIVEMRWEHHEKLRKKNIGDMLKHRKKLLDDDLGDDDQGDS